MFRKPLHLLFKRLAPKALGLTTIIGLSLLHLNQSYKTSQLPSPTASSIPPQQPPSELNLPKNQSYYLVVYDPSQKQILDVVKALLVNQKQKIVYLTNKQYEMNADQQLMEPLTIFYKGSYLPYKIKLDISKGDIVSQSNNIEQFVVTLDKAEDLEALIKSTENSFDNPLFLINVYSEEGYKVLRSQIIALTELHLLNPLQHRIHIIKHQSENSKEINTYHIMRNDLLAQMAGNYELQTFSNPPENANQQILAKARREFIEFLLPRIHVVKDVDDYQVLQQRTNLDNEKYTISIKISPHDMMSQEKLKVLHRLYTKYGKNFNFVVFSTSKFKSFMVHTHQDSDEFVLYNYDKRLESNIQERPTYEKLFLGNYQTQQSFEDNISKIQTSITKFLDGDLKADNLNVIPSQRYFEINIEMLQNLLATEKNPFTLAVCSKRCRDVRKVSAVDYWIDNSIHNIGITRQSYLNIDPIGKVIKQIPQ